jgi:hypothetical protein
VKKPKPNLLEKTTAKQTERSSSTEKSTPSPPPESQSPALTAAQVQRVDELVSELQKMKAIILKHEVRIRELEKRGQNLDNLTQNVGSEANNNGDTNLLPDEV